MERSTGETTLSQSSGLVYLLDYEALTTEHELAVCIPSSSQHIIYSIHIQNALQRHYTENSKQIFPEKELCGLSSNSYIHVPVSDLDISTISLTMLLQENRWTDCGNIQIAHRRMNVEIRT